MMAAAAPLRAQDADTQAAPAPRGKPELSVDALSVVRVIEVIQAVATGNQLS